MQTTSGIVETFVETCDDEEADIRQRRASRRQELEAAGLQCRYEDCYRITDWRRVLLLIAEKIEPASQNEHGKRVVRVDRLSHADQPSPVRQRSLQQRKVRRYQAR